MNEKSLCANRRCNWRGTDKEVLRAPNPFEPGEEMFACPDCRDCESLVTHWEQLVYLHQQLS